MVNTQLEFSFFEKTELRLIFRKLNRVAKFRFSIFLQLLIIAMLTSGFISLILLFQTFILAQRSFLSINLLLLTSSLSASSYYLLLSKKSLPTRFLRHYLKTSRYKKNVEEVILGSPAFMLLSKNARLLPITTAIISKTTDQERAIIGTLLNDLYRGSVKQLLDIAQKL